MVETVDIAIIGGGLVGASLAVALRGYPGRVVLAEATSPPHSPPAWDERCIALNDGSHRILQAWGLWDGIAASVAPITATHISERGRFGVARFTAADAKLPALGYNTPLRVLGAQLQAALQASDAPRFWQGAKLVDITPSEDTQQLQFADGRSLAVRLVVACDGAQSAVRTLLNSPKQVDDYQQCAIVTGVCTEQDVAGVAYERFMPTGPLALLPKPELPEAPSPIPNRACSLIWTLPTATAHTLMQASDDDYLRAAQTAFGERLGRFTALGQRVSWPLQRTVSTTPHAPRVLFCGNAAQSLHPVAAQGFNLGLRDVYALANLLHARAADDPGDATLLARYSQARADDRAHTAGFTHQLVHLFSNRAPGLSQLRSLGLLGLQVLPALRAEVMRQNLGHKGL